MLIVDLFKDEYKFKARLLPAIVCSIPVVILIWIFTHCICQTYKLFVFWGPLFSSLLFSALAIEWFGVMLICWMGRAIENILFDDGLKFPSTEILLWSNDFLSQQNKKSIRDKIANELGIKLLSQRQEENNIVEARKIIRDAIDRIRTIVKDGRTVLQYNIHYGAIRNLIGGCCLACPLSLCVTIIGYFKICEFFILYLGIALVVVYALPLVFLSPLLKSFGKRYAKTLLAEYMTIEYNNK